VRRRSPRTRGPIKHLGGHPPGARAVQNRGPRHGGVNFLYLYPNIYLYLVGNAVFWDLFFVSCFFMLIPGAWFLALEVI
jgi:hypothetical protein